jgi:hypothetical protein
MAKDTNSGDYNSGDYNSGDLNNGDWNSGDWNSGDLNNGDWNSGHRNSGDWNSGDLNNGNWNSGGYNSGDYNSGDYNSGHRNSGHRNSGDYNSGDYNSGDYNSGAFNTDEPKMRLFNKESEYTRTEYAGKFGWKWINLPITRWISKDDMTDQDKKDSPGYTETGGCLKTLGYKEAWKIAWEELDQGKKNWFLNLPNFDATIFEEITGINVDAPENMIEVDGKKWSVSTIKEALRNHAS